MADIGLNGNNAPIYVGEVDWPSYIAALRRLQTERGKDWLNPQYGILIHTFLDQPLNISQANFFDLKQALKGVPGNWAVRALKNKEQLRILVGVVRGN